MEPASQHGAIIPCVASDKQQHLEERYGHLTPVLPALLSVLILADMFGHGKHILAND